MTTTMATRRMATMTKAMIVRETVTRAVHRGCCPPSPGGLRRCALGQVRTSTRVVMTITGMFTVRSARTGR